MIQAIDEELKIQGSRSLKNIRVNAVLIYIFKGYIDDQDMIHETRSITRYFIKIWNKKQKRTTTWYKGGSGANAIG